jgi:hypothetical protein
LKLEKLSAADIQTYMTDLADRGSSSPHTIRDYIKVLKVVLEPARVQWKCWDENPARCVTLPPPIPKKEKWAMTPKEAGQLIAPLLC